MMKGILQALHIKPANACCTSTNDFYHNKRQVHGFCHKPKSLRSIASSEKKPRTTVFLWNADRGGKQCLAVLIDMMATIFVLYR